MRVISEEVNGGDIGHVQDELRFRRVSWIFKLVHEFDGSKMTLVTSSFLPLSKPILYLLQIQWTFHWMHFNWIGSHSYPCSRNVVDRLYSHSKASNRAESDGRSGHDLDPSGYESAVKRGSKPSYYTLSLSVYSVTLSHGFLVTCSFSP